MQLIAVDHHSLYGISGGQLEYISQRLEVRRGRLVMVIRFTDHDVQAANDMRLIDGKYYELEFELGEG